MMESIRIRDSRFECENCPTGSRGATIQCRDCKNRSARDLNLQRTYGITVEQYEELHSVQQGLCAICGRAETLIGNTGKVRSLCVDHDHVTGKVRGLLCSGCNVAIGHLRHDKELLLQAITYLQATD